MRGEEEDEDGKECGNECVRRSVCVWEEDGNVPNGRERRLKWLWLTGHLFTDCPSYTGNARRRNE